jgi:DNA-binding LytR/AlgR family response regulator
MYKCFIIDDEQHAIQTLIKYATDSGQLEVVGTTQNPLEGIKLINSQKNIDITFLDIDMPEISGLDVADLIYDNTAIIFTTGHSGYAVEGFEKNISDFLLKPISFEKFLKSIKKVIARLDEKIPENQEVAIVQNKDYFFVNPGIKGKMLKINYNDVEVIEALNNYILIHTETGKQIIYLTMKEMEAGITQENFIRIHKSFIINIDKVLMMEGNKLTVGKHVLPIGSSYKEKLLQKINNNSIKTHR